ncbi:hypothetical protein EJB05_07103, partial [Eragrostis curvula]
MEEAEMALPDDALAAILVRLPPRSLAACRCVCTTWRAVVDGRRLLLQHVLPHAVRGIFVNYIDYRRPRFFARPSSAAARPAIDGNLDFLPGYGTSFRPIIDHCNGLLLYGGAREMYVANPATRRWQHLPPCKDGGTDCNAYLVFDPAVSPHYEVFLIPRVQEKPRPIDPREYALPIGSRKKRDAWPICPRKKGVDPTTPNLSCLFSSPDDTLVTEDTGDNFREESMELSPALSDEGLLPTISTPSSSSWRDTEPEDPYRSMEWPPSPFTFHVFSSSTGCWEQRSFVREGEAIGTVEDVRLDSLRPMYWGPRWRYAVYWQEALYVHCRGAFIMRLSLINGTYQVIKTPINIEEGKHARPNLGRSENGVYFATIHDNYLLRIWILDELCGDMKWVLKHNVDLERSALWAAIQINYHQRVDGPWILEDNTSDDDDDNNEMLPKQDFEWDSDNGNVLDHEEADEDRFEYIYFLGFHPYKEVVFLKVSFTGIAFHLNTSKVQYLGKLRPKDYYYTYAAGAYESFPYTPCLIGYLPETNQETHPGHQQDM